MRRSNSLHLVLYFLSDLFLNCGLLAPVFGGFQLLLVFCSDASFRCLAQPLFTPNRDSEMPLHNSKLAAATERQRSGRAGRARSTANRDGIPPLPAARLLACIFIWNQDLRDSTRSDSVCALAQVETGSLA